MRGNEWAVRFPERFPSTDFPGAQPYYTQPYYAQPHYQPRIPRTKHYAATRRRYDDVSTYVLENVCFIVGVNSIRCEGVQAGVNVFAQVFHRGINSKM